MVSSGRPVLVAEHGCELGGVAVEASLPLLAFLAVLETVEAGVPAAVAFTMTGAGITRIFSFGDPSLVRVFGFPLVLP